METTLNQSVDYKNLKLITSVKIINYPSKDLVITLLDDFLNEKGLPKDYVILERSIYLLIKFRNSDSAYEFVKRLNYEKLVNEYYSSIEITMNIDIDKRMNKFNKSSSAPRLSKINKTERNQNNSKHYEKPILKKLKFSDFAYTSILASTPYRDPYEEQKKINKENKYKWISNRDFNGYFGKATSNRNYFYHDYISNGIPSRPILYRPVEKEKWMSKQNFLVC